MAVHVSMDTDTRAALQQVAAGNVDQYAVGELEDMGLRSVESLAGRADDDTLMQQAQQLLDENPELKVVTDPEYGEEYALTVSESGCEVRTHAGEIGASMFRADYVRVVAPDGREIGYWQSDEWRDDPRVVMGAVLGAASGVVVEPND